jgi:hypothetical protein
MSPVENKQVRETPRTQRLADACHRAFGAWLRQWFPYDMDPTMRAAYRKAFRAGYRAGTRAEEP